MAGFSLCFVACLLAATLLGATGCSRKAAPRIATAEERAAFVARKTSEAQWALGLNPPRVDQAREAALDALAIDRNAVDARLALSDAEFAEREYCESVKVLKPLEKKGAANQEVLYRQARGLYWYHSWWVEGNYARAREKARACLAAGDKYLLECYAIIRNSYLGEVQGDESKRPGAYASASASAAELLEKLPADHPERGDLLLLLAEYNLDHMNQAARGEEYLKQVRELAQNRPQLAERLATYERERELRAVLAQSK